MDSVADLLALYIAMVAENIHTGVIANILSHWKKFYFLFFLYFFFFQIPEACEVSEQLLQTSRMYKSSTWMTL